MNRSYPTQLSKKTTEMIHARMRLCHFTYFPLRPRLFVLKTLVLATTTMLLTACIFYQHPRSSAVFTSAITSKWPAEVNASQTLKLDTTGNTSLHEVVSGLGEIETTPRDNHVTDSVADLDVLGFDAHFQDVSDRNVWVYSAHYDVYNDSAPVVRILGISKCAWENRTVYCHVTESDRRFIVQGRQANIKEGWNKTDIATIFTCFLEMNSKPLSVSLTFDVTDKPTNALRVVYPKPPERNFTVCHAVLFSFNNTNQLVNSFEINRLFGAEHFYVYNFSVSDATDAVLRHYQKLGLLTIMPWRLPASDVWYHGQVVAINDCVYRNRHASKYVVIHDTDEYIIPEVYDSWADLLREAEDIYFKDGARSTKIKTIGSFIFQSSFYFKSSDQIWPAIKQNFSMTEGDEAFLTSKSALPFLYTLKEGPKRHALERCKSIVRPDDVIHAGIHYVHVYRTSAGRAIVNTSLAVLHHYRRYPQVNVTEVSAMRFLKKALPVLRAAYNSLASDGVVIAPTN